MSRAPPPRPHIPHTLEVARLEAREGDAHLNGGRWVVGGLAETSRASKGEQVLKDAGEAGDVNLIMT